MMIANASTKLGSEWEICIAESIDEVEKLRTVWSGMSVHFNAEIDHYLLNLAARDCVLQPYVMLLLVHGQPAAILIGRIEASRFNFKLGFTTLHGPMTRQLVIIYRGLIGDESKETADRFVTELLQSMARKKIDAVWFFCLPVDSDFYRAAETRPGFFTRDHGVQVKYHWTAKLPASGIDDFLKRISSKHRYWFRRLQKVLEKDFPGRHSYRRFTDASEVDQLCRDCDEIASKTYHRALGAGFVANEHAARRLAFAASRQWLRAYVLYIDGSPKAFWIGTLHARTFYLDFTGYHPDFAKYELGTILFLKMVEDLIGSGVGELDFGLGDLWYKERFGDRNWPEASLFMFAPTFKGISINAVRMSLSLLSQAIKWLLNKAGVFAKLKKRLRDRLTDQTKARS